MMLFKPVAAFAMVVALVGVWDLEAPVGASAAQGDTVLVKLDGLWTMRPDGTNRTRLSSGEATEGTASWAPSGERLVVSRYKIHTRNWDLYLLDASGSVLRRLTRTDASERNPAWSPNGRWIAFDRGVKGIFVMRPDGTKVNRLSEPGRVDRVPVWSPNGSRLAFLSDRRGEGNFDLFVGQSDLSGAKRLRDLGGEVVRVDWGSAGWIALDYYPGGRRPGVFLVRASGRRFHRTGEAYDIHPVWSPDGKRLLVGHDEANRSGIWRMRRDGSVRMRIADEGVPLDWSRR